MDLRSLNPQQRKAVETLSGPVLVLAGAGSGKTRVITFRISHLIDKGVEPSRILAVSFTNKAASEMRERVGHLVGKKVAGTTQLSTFHSLGAAILQREIHHLGYRRPFSILDQYDQVGVLASVLQDLKIDTGQIDVPRVLSVISRAKMERCAPRHMRGFKYDPMMPYAQRAFAPYAGALKSLNAVDFDDLICLVLDLFEDSESIRRKVASRYDFVMVDEYQDTNQTQLDMMKMLVKDHKNLCVVGDDDQSIYGFRGAVSGNILAFSKEFPGAVVVKLEQNYRSTNTILHVANTLIQSNRVRHEKTLWSAEGDGEDIRVVECVDEAEETEFVANEIESLRSEYELRWSDVVILYRVNPQARLFERVLRARRVPFEIVGATEFFDRKEVKDFVAYLKVCLNPEDEISVRRIVNVPGRQIGPTLLERFSGLAASKKIGFFEALEQVVTGQEDVPGLNHAARTHLAKLVSTIQEFRDRFARDGQLASTARELLARVHLVEYYRSRDKSEVACRARVQNIEEVVESIEEFEAYHGGTLEGWLTRMMLDRTKAESSEMGSDCVKLMTLHTSKGLEFPAVFLVGWEEGSLPHERALREEGGIEEERRLAYVGVTRARRFLTISWAASRKRFGQNVETEPSRFLGEIPAEGVMRLRAGDTSGIKEAQAEMNSHFLAALKASLED